MVGDNIGDRAVLLQLIRFFPLEVWISTGLHCIHVYGWPHVCSIPTCAGLL